jgi:hypothetical protein
MSICWLYSQNFQGKKQKFKAPILTPLSLYFWNRCCADLTHTTNSERPSFASEMGQGLWELIITLRNTVFMTKLKRWCP